MKLSNGVRKDTNKLKFVDTVGKIKMMLTVSCCECGEMYSLRGWVTKEDLIGTEFENRIDSIDDKKLHELQNTGKIKDQVDKFYENPVCVYCGSNKVSYL